MPTTLPFDISRLSSRFSVRRMDDADTEEILALCLQNTQYYRYCRKQPTAELIHSDLRITPPGMDLSSKYYVGFYDGPVLTAVMDLIVGYPRADACFIGFFMMNKQRQGEGIGSGIIRDACRAWKEAGFSAVLLGIDKGNPQSTQFWQKNGFRILREAEREDGTILIAEKPL